MEDRVDMIIPTWNSMPELRKCLDGIKIAFPKDVLGDIIAIDRRSIDGSLELAKEYGCRILTSVSSLGGARLLGLKKARTEWVAFIDSYIELPERWHADMLRAVNSEKVGWIYGWTIDDHPHIGKLMFFRMRATYNGRPYKLESHERAFTNNTLC